MQWDNQTVLLALLILPLVAAMLVRARCKQREAAARFAAPAMHGRLFPPHSSVRSWVKGSLLLVGLALLIMAAARPRFGVHFENVRQRGVDLLVLLDVSRSMLADDVAPNRLERAKSDIRDLLRRLSGDRVGLVVFAGKPALTVPLTTDQDLFRIVLEETDPQSAPRGGTLIGDAIRTGLKALPRRANRDQALILITDGEDQNSHSEEAARQAAQRGVKIFTVGLGDSTTGARIPISSQNGQVQYIKDAGQEHWSKLNGRLLEDIALTTRGAYIPAGTRVYDLGQIYEEHLAKLLQGDLVSGHGKRYREQCQLFLAFGLLLVAVEMGISSHPRIVSGLQPNERMP